MYISWWSLPYFSFVFQCLIFFFFFFLLQTLFIQPYSNVGLKSFSRSYLIIPFVTTLRAVGQLMQSVPALTRRQTKTQRTHACGVIYTHALTMRTTHLLLRSRSHICSVLNIQSLTHVSSYQSDAVRVWCKMLLSCDFIISEKEWKSSNLIYIHTMYTLYYNKYLWCYRSDVI